MYNIMNSISSQFPNLVSVSDLQRNYAGLLKNLNTTKKPLFVLKNNKPEAVIILPDLFQTMTERIRELEEKEALFALTVYKKEKQTNRLTKMKTIDELFEN